jgi:hypothetical protein
MVAIDTAEYYRAWSQARFWTDAQKLVAPAMDAQRMYRIILAAMVFDTAAIVFSLSGALALGIATSTESVRAAVAARILATIAVVSGFAYTVDMVLYFLELGTRSVLQGPVFDYVMKIQPPIAMGMAAFAALAPAMLRLFRKSGI